ncbi:MAG: uL30 family ribosomal protein [Candidatus Woesearchaeota archaeon]
MATTQVSQSSSKGKGGAIPGSSLGESKVQAKERKVQRSMPSQQPTGNASLSSGPHASAQQQLVAVVLVRGRVRMDIRIKTALDHLHLTQKHACAVVVPTPSMLGMLRKVKDYVTYGPITQETFALLVKQRKNRLTKPVPSIRGVFYLSPPKKGFERKGIKVSYSCGGALGDRKEAMNDLVCRML